MGSRLTKTVSILTAISALLLIAVYFFPLWTFDFDVPQYPEGLGMQIWINKIGGPINLINGLNHYVGMRPIEAASFPELTLFPWVTAGLIGLGLIAATVRRSWLLVLWVSVFGAFGAFGMADFYRWMFDYGHKLDPRAPIKMAPFTPPLIGDNTIMNFTIIARPGLGAIILTVAFLLGLFALLLQILALRRRHHAA